MKGLVVVFLLLSHICFAQHGPIIESSMPRECYAYSLDLFTKKDTAYAHLSADLMKPNTKTIYVLKTKHVTDLPGEINGYKIKCVDADSNKKLLYTEQTENGAVILYLDRMQRLNLQTNTVVMMPVQMYKKGKKPKVGFENRGYTTLYFFDGPINMFRFERTVYFDYRQPMVKN
ncbi:MAG: hypothetical protein EOP56_08785 [Sphingobacteriales bacterium]|nr:MAG: hypothetical protein EOP56_08785 [Sphingobacteriales bacterium]